MSDRAYTQKIEETALRQQNQAMVEFLTDLRVSATEETKLQIDDLLERIVPDAPVAASTLGRSSDPGEIPGEIPGEANVSAEIGSNDETDIVDEDVFEDQESRATGFVGKGSEVQWLRRVRSEQERHGGDSSQTDGPYGPPGTSMKAASRRIEARQKRKQQERSLPARASASTYYLDVDSIEVDNNVDPFELPTTADAHILLNHYMDTVQEAFPVLSKQTFTAQFCQYYASVSQGTSVTRPHKWLAILNLVFAIGSKHSELMQADWKVVGQSHLVYQSRAQILGLSGSSLVSPPDLMQTQITALLAFYFFSVGHINRAWVLMGTALRFAHALGLHVRNEDPTTSITKKETLVHMWWALYSLEGSLSAIVGRPSFVCEDYCSTPLPLSLGIDQLSDEKSASRRDEQSTRARIDQEAPDVSSTIPEASNSGSFLKNLALLSMIMQKAMVNLYAAKVVAHSWKDLQEEIKGLLDQLQKWSASLPSGLNFFRPNDDVDFQHERLVLETHYIRTKILITRPCLCRLDSRIENQSKASDNFNKKTARICVDTAKTMSALLPSSFNTVYLYRTGSWWSMVPSIMQALIVLLLELSYDTVHFPEDGKEILPSIRKLIHCLRTMAKNNEIAERAYVMAFRVLRGLAQRHNADISDLIRKDTTRAEDSTSSNLEDQPATEESGQETQFSAEAYAQQYGEQGMHAMHADNFFDNRTGYAPMFTFSAAQPQESQWATGSAGGGATVPSNSSRSVLIHGNPFMTNYDEENPVADEDPFFSMEDFMREFQEQ
ncbi:hypothetical protein P280DRAFT_523786 [Massarina eburnea CBS 473.64]|uniref:Xylanolytic transcriptional activator regulatory domain-containing protein n=1 Tax=Massarina eburnea CBS 473.64 TaxID=1395130 RepID=A0A6A6RLA7_9PLEO|nr:hypothetical protein P280DRAFT_523786 [Massarina eburnea CBS 473.64]